MQELNADILKCIKSSALSGAIFLAGLLPLEAHANQSSQLDTDSIEIRSAINSSLDNANIPTPTQKPENVALVVPPTKPLANKHISDIPTPLKRPAGMQFAPPPYATGLLTSKDKAVYEKAFSYLSKYKWRQAVAEADKATYPLPAKFIRWSWLRAYKGGATFEEITSFVIDNPDWPYRQTLLRRAEEALINPIDARRTISWFYERPPITGMGMQRYGEALLAVGQAEEGKKWIRKAWHEGNFSKGLENKFLRQHKKLLSLEDHENRLDRLLWGRRAEDAIRMLDRVSSDQKKVAIARIRLMRMSKNVDAGVRQVPDQLQNDYGFIFDRIKWRRRKGRDEDAQSLLLKVPSTAPYPEIWWREREIQARKLLRKGHITDAYQLASQHGLTSGAKFAEAEWLAGWVALRFLHEYDEALAHFTRLYNNVSYPISRSRGAYWIARSYAALKDKKSARYWYEQGSQFSSTFYGQLSMAELNTNEAPDLKKKSSFGSQAKSRLDQDELVLIVKNLAELGQARYTRPFLMKLTERSQSAEDYVYLAKLSEEIERPDYSVAVAKRASQLGTELPDISWPTAIELPEDAAIEHPLILAITRQESAFATDAVSPAGARGLMQLMPRTAKHVSKKLKLSYSRSRLIQDPAYNVTLGSNYLGNLIDRFDGSYILAIASYNAGGSRVRRWIEDWGDPRRGDINTVDWIELIPFSETRNYVQRVMENLQVYRQLTATPEYELVQLDIDLSRGGPAN
ncbi:lytic transglycosylase domain-containing protein [Sneathiella limimaris]|uniref:lytic transglycosylase domain-containing protein n=1 Tax=Sneathiella limimaris TaxID=1964213 RepID=UPI00146BD1D0|nr:lytic transglycosylase domain-containing protein [Sneathiella limimaris]